MSRSHWKCAVLNCQQPMRKLSFFRFPNPKKKLDRFLQWVAATGNMKLQHALEIDIYNKYRICEQHFKKEDFLKENRLRDDVLPTLHLAVPLQLNIGINLPEEKRSKTIITSPITSAEPSSLILSKKLTSPEGSVAVDMDICAGPSKIIRSEKFHNVETNTLSKETQCPKASRRVTKKGSVLPMVGVKLIKELSPRELFFYREVRKLSRRSKSLEKQNVTNKKKVALLQKALETGSFAKLFKNLTPFQYRFFESHLQNAGRAKKGRKFTFDDKASAIALWKRSPHMYRILAHLFILPSVVTLRKVLNKLSLKPGINRAIFKLLAEQFEKKSLKERVCTLVFDEMSLQPSLEYLSYDDAVVGFENTGYNTTNEIADHVAVFMLRGILKNWKQPVGYFFCKSSLNAATIVRIFKDIVREAEEAGLKIIASICDQGTCNVRAIKMLLDESKRTAALNNINISEHSILIDNCRIIPLFDPPHLLRSLRNNLLTKDLQFCINNVQYIAKWEHILNAYKIDRSYNIGIMKKLTDFHVVPNKVKKMKVSHCTQVFSETVAAGLKFCAIFNAQDKDSTITVSSEALQTVELILFLDKLFDSVNGSSSSSTAGKNLKKPVGKTSQHAEFWKNAISIFQSMKFIKRKPEDRIRPPTISGWIGTLNGFLELRRSLLALGFHQFSARCFNQDPIENFFCQVRQYGSRNINPSCAAFGPYYKSLLIKNFSKMHVKSANCENDHSTIAVQLRTLLSFPKEDESPEKWHPPPFTDCDLAHTERAALGYISGYLLKNKIKTIQTCEICKSNILQTEAPNEYFHKLVELKERWKDEKHLIYIKTTVIQNMIKMYQILENVIPSVLHINYILQRVISFVKCNVTFGFDECSHTRDVEDLLVKKFVKLYIYTYLKKLNNIAKGKCALSNLNEIESKILKLSKFYKK